MRENTHMEHFEDLLFESWGVELLNAFQHGEVGFTRKWDGAPSIFFGCDIRGCWIARKGLFNKDAKKYYKRSDFDADPKFPEGLKESLWNTLVYLGNAYTGGVNKDTFIQGDLMFADGPNRGDFHPNTIKYTTTKVPESARVGIVWHTAYVNDEIKYGARIKEHFKITDELWMINAHDEVAQHTHFGDAIQDLAGDHGTLATYHNLSDEAKCVFKQYQNALVRGDQVRSYNTGLIEYVFDCMAKKVESVSKDETKHKYMMKYKAIAVEFAAASSLELHYSQMTEVKMILVKYFNSLPSVYKTSLVTKQGTEIPCNHEGYAMFYEGSAAKLVDRQEFSKANFSDEYVKGWQS